MEGIKSDIDFLKKKVSFIYSKVTTSASQEFSGTVNLTPNRSVEMPMRAVIPLRSSTTPMSPSTPPMPVDTILTPPAVSNTASMPPLVSSSQSTNQGSKVQESDNTAKELIPPDRLTQIFCKSCSRCNFAVNLVRELFTTEVRKTSNVTGRNKEQLDKAKMAYIKATVFKYHPCTQADKLSEAWKDCILMIDESNRRLNKTKKV